MRLKPLTQAVLRLCLLLLTAFAGCGGDSSDPTKIEANAKRTVEGDQGSESSGGVARAEPEIPKGAASDNTAKTSQSKPSKPISDHQRMVGQLANIHEENQNNPYFEGALARAQQSYAQAKQSRNPYQAMPALYDLSNEWIQKGQPDKGLETLEELQSIMDFVIARKPGVVNEKMVISTNLAGAIAGIRKGENENCVNCIGGEGCLFPIGPQGVHRRQEGSKIALKYLDVVLKKDPNDMAAIWLLNIAHMTLGSHPEGVPKKYRLPEDRLKSPIDFPRFKNISSDLNVDTFSHAGGVVVDDFDGDLDFDIFVSSWATDGQCRFFRNQGDQGFIDQTEAVGLSGIVGGLNTRQIDFDNDGDPDILILRGAWLRTHGRHPNSLLRNDGGDKFVEVAFQTGVAGKDFPTQTAGVADYDLDGDLDLFVGNEGEPDQLFRNDDGVFTDVAAKSGIIGKGYAKGVAWGDVDNDGDPDLYVSNLGEPNQLYQNLGNGSFQPWKGADVGSPRQSFSCWFFDYDNDGNLDLFVAAYDEGIEQVAADYFGQRMDVSDHDRLYRGDGKGGFEDVTESVGLGRVSQTMGSNFGDLNNDGWLDFYLATGSPAIEALQPNLMYLNQNAERFVDVSIAGGFSHLQKGHAIAFADLDHDGDQDVFAELGGAYQGDAFQNALFQNPGFDGRWIKLELTGTASNVSAVGARVEVVCNGPTGRRSIHRVVGCGSSFGCNPLRLHVGLGDTTDVVEVLVRWPGQVEPERFSGVQPGGAYELRESSGQSVEQPLKSITWQLKEPAPNQDSEEDTGKNEPNGQSDPAAATSPRRTEGA